MKSKYKLLFLLPILLVLLWPVACKEDLGPQPSYRYEIRLTDAPATVYQEVNIDVQGVEVTGSSGVVEPEKVVPGIYNLLNYTNGNSVLLSTGALSDGKIQQIRLILGPNNTVKINGQVLPLSTPSADQSGLKLQVHAQLMGGVQYSLLLDFDAYQSVVSTGNGTYKLKPTIRVYTSATGGTIRGTTSPVVKGASVAVVASTGEQYSSSTDAAGGFMVQGLPAGTYSVTITSPDQKTATRSNISVTIGAVTDLGAMTLQ